MDNSPDLILKIGTVLRFYVTDTIPPKVKRLIITGIDNEQVTTATIFINSEINPTFLLLKNLKDCNINLKQADVRSLIMTLMLIVPI